MPFAGTTEAPDNRAIRDLRDEVRDLNGTLNQTIRSNTRTSKAFFLLAMTQIFIAFFQFAYDALESPQPWKGALWFGSLAGVIFLLFWSVDIDKEAG
jgi:hypothetical protein